MLLKRWGGAGEGWGSVGAQERESNVEGGAGNPAPTPVRGPAKCGEVPDGDLGELSQLGGLVGEKEEEEGAHRRLPDTPHT